MNINNDIPQQNGLKLGKPSEILLGNNISGNDLAYIDYVNHMYVKENFICGKYFIYEGPSSCIYYVFDMYTKKHISELKGHKWSMNRVILNGNILISCSTDKTIKIWNILSGECIRTLTGHKCHVRDIILKDNIIYSISSDKTIKKWDYNTGICLKTITHQDITDYTTRLLIKNNMLICSCGYKVLILDTVNDEFIQQLSPKKRNLIANIYFNDDELIVQYINKELDIWDLKTYKCLDTIYGYKSSTLSNMNSITRDRTLIIKTHSEKSEIEIYDTTNSKHTNLSKIKCRNTNSINSIYLINNTMITRAQNEINFWNITTGECIKTINGYKLLVSDNLITIISEDVNKDTYLTIIPIILEDTREIEVFRTCIANYNIDSYIEREIMRYFM